MTAPLLAGGRAGICVRACVHARTVPSLLPVPAPLQQGSYVRLLLWQAPRSLPPPPETTLTTHPPTPFLPIPPPLQVLETLAATAYPDKFRMRYPAVKRAYRDLIRWLDPDTWLNDEASPNEEYQVRGGQGRGGAWRLGCGAAASASRPLAVCAFW